MSKPFSRVKPGSWAFGEILTSAQMNSLDTNVSNASASSNSDLETSRTGVQVPFGNGVAEGLNNQGWEVVGQTWLQQNDISVTGRWRIDLSGWLPHGVTVTAVQALAHGNAQGGATHGASMPATMPVIAFYEYSSSGTSNYSALQSDTSANAGAYEIDHPIDLTVSRTVDRLFHYWVTVTGELNANALNLHFAVKGLSITWTAP